MLGDDRFGGCARAFRSDTANDNGSVAALVRTEFAAFVSDDCGRPVLDKRAKLAFERGDDGDTFQLKHYVIRARLSECVLRSIQKTCFVFANQKQIPRLRSTLSAREIPHSAGESAELRDDAGLSGLHVSVLTEPGHRPAKGVVYGDDLPPQFALGFGG